MAGASRFLRDRTAPAIAAAVLFLFPAVRLAVAAVPAPRTRANTLAASADTSAVPAPDSSAVHRAGPENDTHDRARDSAVVDGFAPPFLGDSLRVRFEVGASYDYTNEIYYLDSLATPTLTTRERFDVPQARSAGVWLAHLEGTRAGGGTAYALSHELSLGDRLRRASLLGRWRQQISPDWRLLVVPRAEYRHDRTLGRNFEEYQASGAARVRREGNGGLSSLEGGLQADWLHTTGSGAGLLADRWAVAAAIAAERGALSNVEGRLDYSLRARFFPDSVVRDHLEHETRGRLRLGWGLAHSLTLEAAAIRRVTIHLAPTSLDNFWEETLSADLLLGGAASLGAAVHVGAEAVQFDLEDQVLYFRHELVRARGGPRLQPLGSWSLEAGPRGEWLRAPAPTEEAYDEIAAYSEFESITPGALWTVTPAAGRRRYRDVASATEFPGTGIGRSSYRFVELDLLGDQRLFGPWRARLAANGRWEFHDDAVENAGSLYFAVDVRRLF